MFNICIPIDDYIDKTFFIKNNDMIILPKIKNDNRKTLNLSFSLEDTNNNEILNALTDGFVNGYIESYKDITKGLLNQNYTYEEIINITGLSPESIYKINNEL